VLALIGSRSGGIFTVSCVGVSAVINSQYMGQSEIRVVISSVAHIATRPIVRRLAGLSCSAFVAID
jgi:hypothetical protein